MSTIRGQVANVTARQAGSELAADAPVGALRLVVADLADFSEDGGSVMVDDESPFVIVYTGFDEGAEDDESVPDALVLASGLTRALPADDTILLALDDESGEVVREVVAEVVVNTDETNDGDAVEAVVDHALIPYLPEGYREYGEIVELAYRDDTIYLVNILSTTPVFDGTMIDPETIPFPEIPEPEPAPFLTESPAVRLAGTASGLVVEVLGEVHPSTAFTFHVTDHVESDADGNVFDFEVSAATAVNAIPTRQTLTVLTTLPDGSPLLPEVSYFVRVVASNESTPSGAPAGPMHSATLDMTVVHDTITGSITAGFGLMGALTVGEITIHPDTGITVPTPKGGIHLPSDGETPATFAGTVYTDELVVEDNLTINGEENSINGSLSLANVVIPPAQYAGLRDQWEYAKPLGTDILSLCHRHDDASWLSVHLPTNTIKGYNKTTGALTVTFGPYTNSGWSLRGVTNAGTFYYALAVSTKSPYDVHMLKLNTTGSVQSTWKVATSGATAGWMGCGRTAEGYIQAAWAEAAGKTVRVVTYGSTGNMLRNEVFDAQGVYGFDGAATGISGLVHGPYGRNGESAQVIVMGSVPQVFDPVTKKHLFAPGWSEACKGIAADSDKSLRYIGYSTYRVYRYNTENFWDEPVSVAYSWRDSDPEGSGEHETTPSKPWVFQPSIWASLSVTVPPPADFGNPDDPDSVRVYIDGHRQPDPARGQTSMVYRTVEQSGIPAPTENGFESAAPNPGKVRSTAVGADDKPLFEVTGNGTGRWGQLEVNARGIVTIGGDTGWIEVNSFGQGWENYPASPTAGYAPAAYRRIGNRVLLRGLVRDGPVSTRILTLPEGFRPVYRSILTAASGAMERSFDATGDGAKTGLRTDVPGNNTASHRHDFDVPAYDIKTVVNLPYNVTRLDVYANGELWIFDAAVKTTFISLDGIEFLID